MDLLQVTGHLGNGKSEVKKDDAQIKILPKTEATNTFALQEKKEEGSSPEPKGTFIYSNVDCSGESDRDGQSWLEA